MTTRFPGLGHRFSDRLQMLGFWKDGRPDVGRFCREKGYRPQYVYAWLKDRMPAYDNVQRLCTDLDVPVIWFVVGEDGNHPATRTGPAHDGRRRAQSPRAAGPVPMRSFDLAPLREATEKITALQAELEALLAAFPDPCWWCDDAGRIIEMNPSAAGTLPATTVGRSLRETFPPEAAATLQRALTTALKSDDVTTVEYTLPTNGSRRSRTWEARIRPVLDYGGRRPRKALFVIRDVTEHRVREHEYRDLIEGASNGLCIHSDYVIQYANRTVAQMLGHANAGDLVGRDIREVLPDCPGQRAAMARDGRLRARSTTTAVLRNGERAAVVATARRVTWRSQPAMLVTVLPPASTGR